MKAFIHTHIIHLLTTISSSYPLHFIQNKCYNFAMKLSPQQQNKLTISKNGRFVQIMPKPKKDILNGLKVYLSSVMYKDQEEYMLPIATTSIVANKCKYFLPNNCDVKIVRAEIKQ